MTRSAPLLAIAALALFSPDVARAEVVGTGLDSATTPGQATTLRAKFEHGRWLRIDVRYRSVEFRCDALGVRTTARTDIDGVATASITPARAGTFRFTARLLDDDGPTTSGRLFVYDPAKPILVTDIDGTISDLPDWQVPFRGHKAPVFKGSPETLARLAQRYRIVYLTARDDRWDGKTREFLRRNGFPDGPVFYNDLGLLTHAEREQLEPEHHGQFKLGVIRGLSSRGVDVRVGLGNAETDAWAYEQAGIRSYIRTTEPGSGPSFRFSDDVQLRRQMVIDGVLTPPTSPGLTGAVQGSGAR